MDVTVREARPPDAPTLEVLRRQAVDDAVRTYTGEPSADALPGADLHERIDDDRYAVRVVETEVTGVSYAVLDREAGRLSELFTAPNYQREGFASVLLDRVGSVAADAGREALTAVAPAPARQFFLANGFEPVGEMESEARFGLPATRYRTGLY